ncbi:mpv17-like protein 2 [Drosophila subobscura]|uniref:mpv17-like protein 2 n=1 Tax=Drosophila subobscura TaxID=7241 RepID=UPI00155A71DC|nr:mpv17-like protein 2 [Drosophila subobscura]
MFRRARWRRVLQGVNRWHSVAFSKRYLLYTNLGISFSLSMVGDTMEQAYERYLGEIDAWNGTRTLRMGMGGLTVGVVCHYWYQYLDYRYPNRTIRTVMRKILLDQIICSPFYITVFFITMGLLERQSWEEFREEVMEKAVVLYMAEWTFWPAAQFVNFFLIKPRYRVFYDNSMSLGYDIYTSGVKYRKKPSLENTVK